MTAPGKSEGIARNKALLALRPKGIAVTMVFSVYRNCPRAEYTRARFPGGAGGGAKIGSPGTKCVFWIGLFFGGVYD